MPTKRSWKKTWKSTVRLNVNQEKILLLLHHIEVNLHGDLFTLQELSNQLGLATSTTHYSISQLKSRGLIERPIKGIYCLTTDGKKILSKILKGVAYATKKFRPHHIQIIFPILKNPNSKQLHQLCTPISNGRYQGFKHAVEDATIMFYGKTVHASCKGFYTSDIDDIHHTIIIEYVNPLIKYLEKVFNMKLDENKVTIKVQHLALMDHPIAKLFKKAGRNYMSKFIHVDASNGNPEMETVNSKNALEHMKRIMPTLDKLEKELEESMKEKPILLWNTKWK
jgi:hypothetical protein